MVIGIRRLTAVALCLALLLPLIMASSEAQGESADRTVIFTEDFEHAWPGTLPNGWDRWDLDDGSDIDYWCRSMYEAVTPTHAAWCAQIGYNSLYQNAMNKNVTRLEEPNTTYLPKDYVLRYDANMDSYMRRPLVGLDSFTSVTMTFRYWALTGDSTASIGTDYLWVSVSSSNESMPDANDREEIWKQPASNSSGWKTVTLTVPTDSTWISFNFRSGADVPAGEPLVGVFLDDILVEGIDDQAPVSRVGSLPTATAQRSFDVPITLSEGSTGLKYIELWYRINGSGSFLLYTEADAPSGRWGSSPVPFLAPLDGRYELFSRAADIWGNVEPLKTSADVAIIVDGVDPSSVVEITGMWGSYDWYISPAKILLTGWDDSSGISQISYRWDGGLWNKYSGQLTAGMDGRHVLEYYATDRAGNKETIRTAVVHVDVTGPTVTFGAAEGRVFASGDLVLRYEASDPASGIGLADYSVDGSSFKMLSQHAREIALTDLAEGAHHLVLRVWDNAGNPTEVALNISVDHSAASSDLAATIAPLAMTAITLLGLVAVVMLARRHG